MQYIKALNTLLLIYTDAVMHFNYTLVITFAWWLPQKLKYSVKIYFYRRTMWACQSVDVSLSSSIKINTATNSKSTNYE